jgi:hypothetical protein
VTVIGQRLKKKYVDFAVDMWTICGLVDTYVDISGKVVQQKGMI